MLKKIKIENMLILLLAMKLGVFALILQTQAGEITTVSFGTPVYAQEPGTTDAGKAPAGRNEAKQTAAGQVNLEILQSIEQKEQALNKREESLKKREEQLNLLGTEIEKKLAEIKKAQNNIERMVTMREDLVEKSIRHLVKVFSSMKPAEAGPLLEKLDRDITIQILSKMKGKTAGKILAKIKPTLAARLSEEIAKRK